MKSVVIVGAGGFGREVLEIFKDLDKRAGPVRVLGFVDEDENLYGRTMNGYPVLGGLDWLKRHVAECTCVCAIGDPATRKDVVRRVYESGASFTNAIHPSVIMSDSVELGDGVIICAGSILTVNIQVGDHVHINLNSTIGHDTAIGPYSTICPAVSISGHGRLDEGVFVGTGAVLVPDIAVGSWATIGAGTVALHDIPDGSVAVGVPARVVRTAKSGEFRSNEHSLGKARYY